MKTIQNNSVVVLGLDIGKASVGFALIDKANSYQIINAGVRIFDAPEKPKEQTSLNLERGQFIRNRNSSENEFYRTKNIVKTMLKYDILDVETIRNYDKNPKLKNIPKSKKKRLFYIKTAQYLFYGKSNSNDILNLRVKALDTRLSNIEFARLLYSMNNHRGVTYDEIAEVKSTDKSSLSPDQKNLKDGFERYKKEYHDANSSYETVGVYLYKNYKNKFRNSNKKYIFSIPRDDLKSELEVIFGRQRELENNYATKEFEEEYLKWFLWEKESPDYYILVAPCEYDFDKSSLKEIFKKKLTQEELKYILTHRISAHKHHFISQLYISLEKLYNIRYRKIGSKTYQELSNEENKTILNNSFDKKKGLSYKDIKKILGLKDIEFKGVLEEDKAIVTNFDTFFKIKKILDLEFNPLDEIANQNSFLHNEYKNIIEILAYKTKDSIKAGELQNLKIPKENIEKLLKIKIRGHLSYSYEVVRKLCNYMLDEKDGLKPHNAKEKIKDEYGVKSIDKKAYLPPILDTDFPLPNNHTAIRALSQVRTIINDILKQYRKETNNPNWTFDEVVIELAREMNSKKQVSSINRLISNNTKANQEAKEFCEKYNIYNPTNNQIQKAKLWLIQSGIDPYIWIKNDENKNVEQYTLGKIEASKLFKEDYCQIEHTLPFSRSLDDSQSNKILVLTKTNQDKGDKTPHEWLSKDEFEKFEKYLRSKDIWKSYGDARIRKLLMKDFKGVDGFKQRDIVDTQIISKYAGLYINNHLRFWNNPTFTNTRRVYANNGKITSILRNAWAIGKKNRDNHLHHAQDAILIACSSPSLIKDISTFVNLQSQLTTGKLTQKKFDYLLSNQTSLKQHILDELSKQNISLEDEDIGSHIFKIIANRNYPYEEFRDDFKKVIENAPVTHFVKKKINGSIHDETISKKKNDKEKGIEIRDGISRNGGYVRYDIFKIENSKGKITYDFVNITARYYDNDLIELPTPDLKDGEKSSFMFSIYKNDLLSYSLKDGSKIIGNFVKVDSSIVIREPKNLETKLFKKQIKGLNNSWLKTDDIEDFKDILLDKNIQSKLNLKLEKVAKIDSQVEKISKMCDDISTIIKTKYGINTIFTMDRLNSIDGKKLRDILIESNIIKENIELNTTKTIFINFSSSGFIPSFRTDGQKKLIDLKKLKINSLGSIIQTITEEKREPLR